MTLVTDMTQSIAREPGDPEVVETGHSSLTGLDKAARALGWFSLGLGLAEVFAAGKIADTLGVEGKEGLIRTYGVRELGAGMMSLSLNKETGIGSRVAGDALDMATLLPVLMSSRKKGNVLIALAVVAGIAALDTYVFTALKKENARSEPPRDFSDRSGFPGGVQAARGAALKNFETPRDFQVTTREDQPPVPRLPAI
ncbi:hypothetical protein [Altericroceibacterium xinjiangense]|uniref:hypothetical protein n=1 Tax=Altericroceibacterium xinjiangense TaxID=762261 RepID=UPI0019D2ADD8|nr:hypothetical protein [Altericroceibacterium xinjiangense]